MTQKSVILLLFLLCLGNLQAQVLPISFSNSYQFSGDTACVELTVEDFNNIGSLQFSVAWDANTLQYLDSNMGAIEGQGLNLTNPNNDFLTYTFLDLSGTGFSIPDGSVILKIYFLVLGNPGDISIIEITNAPIPMEVSHIINNVANLITLAPSNGNISILPVINIDAEIQAVACFGGNDGAIDLNVLGDTTNLEIQWNNNGNLFSNEQDIVDLTNGNYELSVFFNDSILLLDTIFQILQPGLPVLLAPVNSTTITCANPTGTATVSANGGTTPYTYFWSHNNAINDISANDLPAGIHQIIVEDAQGCSDTISIEISENTNLPEGLFAEGTDINCINDSSQLMGNAISNNLVFFWYNEDSSFTSNLQNPIIDIPDEYFLTAIDTTNACFSTIATSINIDTLAPNINLVVDGALSCNGDPVILSAHTLPLENTISWQGPNGFNSQDSSIQINEAGIYEVEIINLQNGCNTLISTEIEADTLAPQAEIEIFGEWNCTTQTIQLNAADVEVEEIILWEFPNGNASQSQNILINEAGTYVLTVTDTLNNCFASNFIEIIPDTIAPNVNIEGNNELNCVNESVILNAQTIDFGLSYIWQNENVFLSTSQSVEISEAGDYQLTATAPNGCTAISEVIIFENVEAPIAEIALPEDTILTCDNSAVLLSANNLASNDFLWTDEFGVTISFQSEINISLSGFYNLIVTNPENGCSSESQIFVPINTIAPIAQIEIDSAFSCLNPCAFLDASQSSFGNEFIYTWESEDGNEIENPDDFSAITYTSGIYNLTITNLENGCTTQANISILLGSEPEPNGENQIFLPNIFSPNNDGINDQFFPQGNAEISKINQLLIFDRWGGMVFQKENFLPNLAANGWNGEQNGEKAPQGIYTYWLEIEFSNGETRQIGGDVLLVP